MIFIRNINFVICIKNYKKNDITDLFNINNKFLEKLDDTKLLSYKNVKYLDSSYFKIYTLDPFIKLQKLTIKSYHKNDSHLKHLNLEYLDVKLCERIENLNHMSNLKTLILYDNYRTTANLDKLKLESLSLSGCRVHLGDVSMLTKFESDRCELYASDLKNMTNLEELKIKNDVSIVDINHLAKLKKLTILYNTMMTKNGITNLTNIGFLKFECFDNIINISHLYKLKQLYATRAKNISVDNFTDLETLHVRQVSGVKTIKHLTKLKELVLTGDCGIKSSELSKTIEYLDVTDNIIIKDVNHLKRLKVLKACGKCGLNDKGIRYLDLTEINISKNDKITNLNYMTSLKNIVAHSCPKFTINSIKKLNLNLIIIQT